MQRDLPAGDLDFDGQTLSVRGQPLMPGQYRLTGTPPGTDAVLTVAGPDTPGPVEARPADRRHWCVICPDLILPGEAMVTLPPAASMGAPDTSAHADCAAAAGWCVTGAETIPDVDFRAAFRAGVRTASTDSADTDG